MQYGDLETKGNTVTVEGISLVMEEWTNIGGAIDMKVYTEPMDDVPINLTGNQVTSSELSFTAKIPHLIALSA